MNRLLEKLKSLYVEPELQFRIVLGILTLITLEGACFGWGIMKLVSLAGDWQRPNMVWDFFKILLLVLVPLVVFNLAIGFYWSVRLARPLHELQKGLQNLRDGRLQSTLESHPQDALKDLVAGFNESMAKIHAIIHRDYNLVQETLLDLKNGESSNPQEFKQVLKSVRSKLSIVNSHFHKPVKG